MRREIMSVIFFPTAIHNLNLIMRKYQTNLNRGILYRIPHPQKCHDKKGQGKSKKILDCSKLRSHDGKMQPSILD